MATPKMAGMTPGTLTGFSPALMGQSPAALLKSKSPLPGGVFASSPSTMMGIGLNVGNDISLGMTPTMTVPAGAPDDANKRELAEIINMLRPHLGRISKDAIERLAKGMELECYKENHPGSAKEIVSVAASIFVLDIEFDGNEVVNVTVSFDETMCESSNKLAPQAAAIFRDNLTTKSLGPSGRLRLLPPTLTNFTENLQRLANTDKLCTTNSNCFNAITGIYESLSKVYEYEKTHMGGAVAALCFGNGFPQMHVRGKVGLSIDYWKKRRLAMEEGKPEKGGVGEQDIWRILIEVQEIPPHDYAGMPPVAPIRVSNEWVSDEVMKPKDDSLFGDVEEFVTDWREPPEQGESLPSDPSKPTPPAARFLARLDPPVPIPFEDASSNGDDLATLLFPNAVLHERVDRSVHIPGTEPDGVIHSYRLSSSSKPVYSRMVSEIPFSHPRDLLNFLKILRQFAVASTILGSCFLRDPVKKLVIDGSDDDDEEEEDDIEDLESFMDDDDDDDHEMADVGMRNGGHRKTSFVVDVALKMEMDFYIALVFPRGDDIVHLDIEVGKNGEIRVEGKGGGEFNVAAFEKALRAGEDVPLALEWAARC